MTAGDLSDARLVQVILVFGDEAADTDVLGTAFDKVDACRYGVLSGMQTCQLLLGPTPSAVDV